MTKIRGNPLEVALAHETRKDIVRTMQGGAEFSTVQIQEAIGVTRYHLYHHLQQLVKAEIIANHRDQGRARWWRLTKEINLGDNKSSIVQDTSLLPSEALSLIENGAEMHWIETPKSARDAIAAKKMLESISEEWGIELNLPFTFTPGGILIIGKPRN